MRVRPTSPHAREADIQGGPLPYTERGLQRLTCHRPGCDRPAREQWHFRSCAIGGSSVWVPVCAECDAELNELVLRFWKWPGVNIAAAMRDYRARLGLAGKPKPKAPEPTTPNPVAAVEKPKRRKR